MSEDGFCSWQVPGERLPMSGAYFGYAETSAAVYGCAAGPNRLILAQTIPGRAAD